MALESQPLSIVNVKSGQGEQGPAGPQGPAGQNGQDGADGKDGVSVIGTQTQYAQSTSGNVQPSSWSDTLISPTPGMYMWSRTRELLSDSTYTNWRYSVNLNGKDAIFISENPPSNPEVGALWQQTSDLSATVLKWNGNSWENWGISVDNIVADNIVAENGVFEKITGLEIEAGTIRNPYSRTYQDDTSANGQITLDDAAIFNRGVITNLISGDKERYEQELSHQLLSFQRSYADANGNATQLKASAQFQFNNIAFYDWDNYQSVIYGSNNISMSDARVTVGTSNLTIHDLTNVPDTLLSPASGWKRYNDDINNTNAPVASRNGRLVQLSGAFSPIAQQAAGSTYTIAQTLPIWARPRRHVTVIQQGSGLNRHLIEVSTAGVITVSRYGTSSEVALPANAWINISCVYAGRNLF